MKNTYQINHLSSCPNKSKTAKGFQDVVSNNTENPPRGGDDFFLSWKIFDANVEFHYSIEKKISVESQWSFSGAPKNASK